MQVRSYLSALLSVFSIFAAEETWAAYADVVLADSPVAYYRFEETSGGVANDSSGNSNTGSYMNGVSLNQPSSSELGVSALFDGSNDYVDTARTVAGDFTLEAWINTSATSPGGSHAYEGDGILWSDVGGNANDFVLGILNDQLAFTTGNIDTTASAGPQLNDGRWHHLVATRSQTGGTVEIYVDGALVGSAASNNNLLSDSSVIHIGGNTGDGRYFDGRIDEVAYYPSVLSLTRIQAHYYAGAPVSVSLPVPTLNQWGMMVLMLLVAIGPMYYLRKQRA